MNYFDDRLATLRANGNLRSIPAENHTDDIIDLSTNDYMGLGTRHDLQQRFFADRYNRSIPMTSSASRLLASCQREYNLLEQRLEELYNRPALLFNSGYHVNTGLVPTLADKHTLILADRLVHASIIDGIKLSGATFSRFPHNDLGRLERMLARDAHRYERVLIIVESVYSMDGDSPDIERLIDLKRDFPNVMLYIDEAHAFGICGPHGLGLSMASPRNESIDVIVGTLGKAGASAGAFCITSTSIKDYLINTARSLIFSTVIPPMTAAWSRFMIDILVEMDDERNHLYETGLRLFNALNPGKNAPVTTHIQPFIVGDATRAVSLSRGLLADGFKVLPIRTPTVPPGTERLRISLNASLDTATIDRFKTLLQNRRDAPTGASPK